MFIGARWFVEILEKMRIRWGISGAFAGALIALATTLPEVCMNISSVTLGVSNIGLGNSFGSNILNIPILVLIAFFASRIFLKRDLAVARETIWYHSLPYLCFIGLVALITLLPEPLFGFQWYDGLILALAYILYVKVMITKGRTKPTHIYIEPKKKTLAIVGFIILAVSAFFAIVASETIAQMLKINELVAGLFIAAMASSLPEALASWHAVRVDQSIAAATSVIDDNIISITLALVPITLAATIADLPLYIVSLIFIAITGIEYTWFGYSGYHFSVGEVIGLLITYAVYIWIVFYLTL
jgi:cation:H+ antiporter